MIPHPPISPPVHTSPASLPKGISAWDIAPDGREYGEFGGVVCSCEGERCLRGGLGYALVWEEAVEALDEVERLGRCETRDTGKQNLDRTSGKKTEAVVRLNPTTFGTGNFENARVGWMRPREGLHFTIYYGGSGTGITAASNDMLDVDRSGTPSSVVHLQCHRGIVRAFM
jgi:hypothetical protein